MASGNTVLAPAWLRPSNTARRADSQPGMATGVAAARPPPAGIRAQTRATRRQTSKRVRVLERSVDSVAAARAAVPESASPPRSSSAAAASSASLASSGAGSGWNVPVPPLPCGSAFDNQFPTLTGQVLHTSRLTPPGHSPVAASPVKDVATVPQPRAWSAAVSDPAAGRHRVAPSTAASKHAAAPAPASARDVRVVPPVWKRGHAPAPLTGLRRRDSRRSSAPAPSAAAATAAAASSTSAGRGFTPMQRKPVVSVFGTSSQATAPLNQPDDSRGAFESLFNDLMRKMGGGAGYDAAQLGVGGDDDASASLTEPEVSEFRARHPDASTSRGVRHTPEAIGEWLRASLSRDMSPRDPDTDSSFSLEDEHDAHAAPACRRHDRGDAACLGSRCGDFDDSPAAPATATATTAAGGAGDLASRSCADGAAACPAAAHDTVWSQQQDDRAERQPVSVTI